MAGALPDLFRGPAMTSGDFARVCTHFQTRAQSANASIMAWWLASDSSRAMKGMGQ